MIWTIVVIGICTLFLRAIFLYIEPVNLKDPVIRKGMDAIPTSLLVGLVFPFLLFNDGEFNVFNKEVLSALITVPVVYLTKSPWLGIVVVFSFYYLLSLIF